MKREHLTAKDPNKEWMLEIIPHVEEMLDKERQHNKYLYKQRRRALDIKMPYLIHEIDQMISRSTSSLSHLAQRLQEYKAFAQTAIDQATLNQ